MKKSKKPRPKTLKSNERTQVKPNQEKKQRPNNNTISARKNAVNAKQTKGKRQTLAKINLKLKPHSGQTLKATKGTGNPKQYNGKQIKKTNQQKHQHYFCSQKCCKRPKNKRKTSNISENYFETKIILRTNLKCLKGHRQAQTTQ